MQTPAVLLMFIHAVLIVQGQICVPVNECPDHLIHNDIHGPPRLCDLSDNSRGVICQSAADRMDSVYVVQPSNDAGNSSEPRTGDAVKEERDNKTSVGGTASPEAVNATYRVNVTVGHNRPRKAYLEPKQMRVKAQEFVIDGEKVLNAVPTAKKRLQQSVLQELLRNEQKLGSNLFRNQTMRQIKFFPKETVESQKEANNTRLEVEVLVVLKETGAMHEKDGTRRRHRRDIRSMTRIPNCVPMKMPLCWREPQAKYWRNDNGQCNNMKHARLGAVQTAQARLLRPQFEDGIWEPKKTGRRGKPLTSPRLISTNIIDTTPIDDPNHTTSLMLFGQFIAHDIVSSGTVRPEGLESCCLDTKFPPVKLHKDCDPIRIPWNDYLYGPIQMDCMNQFRSRPAAFEDCVARPVSPANQATHYLDASIIYGSGSERAGELRSKKGGKIKMDEKNFLPMKDGQFLTGESRSNVVPLLTFMHTVWAREHNRIAEAVEKHNPQWNNLRLYLMARRIMVAEYQHIVYNEYLPTILGQKYMDNHGISVDVDNKLGYSDKVDPSVTVEFSTAAFRFGHSQVQDEFELRSQDGKLERKVFTAASFFKEELLKEEGMFERLARSLIYQTPLSVGPSYSSALHERLFANSFENKGLDLVALNLNRGRDHGLPGYVDVLEACTGRRFFTWFSLLEFVDSNLLYKLTGVYDDIHDIDLYIGGTIEKKKPGALVGEVFQCIIGEQFFSLYHGDRFFYLHGNMTSSFIEDQLKEIKKASWARVLCDNVANFTHVQPLALWQAHERFNPRQNCDSLAIPSMDLSVFKF